MSEFKSIKIDKRDSKKILEELFNLVPYYTPEWKALNDNGQEDLGTTLSKIFANILENVISRLNNTPQLNLIEFLNKLGTNLISAQPSKVPVKFNLSDKVTQNVGVPAGTELATSSTDKHDVLTFETLENMVVTPAKLLEVYSFANNTDSIYRHTQDYVNGKSFFVFGGENSDNLQEHLLYLAHEDLFNIKSSKIKITLTIKLASSISALDVANFFNNEQLVWEYGWKLDPNSGNEIADSAIKFNTEIQKTSASKHSVVMKLKKPDEQEIQRLKVNGIESHWIRCNLREKLSFAVDTPLVGLEHLHFVNGVDIIVSSSDDLSPDLLSYNYLPLTEETNNGTKEILPFGKRPMTFDSFYIASRDAFSKKLSEITLTFDAFSEDTKFIIPKAALSWEYWNGRDWTSINNVVQSQSAQNVVFTCPQDIEVVQVSGNQNHWIRARIASGNYGDLKIQSTTTKKKKDGSQTTTYNLNDDDIKYPCLTSITIKVCASDKPQHPNLCFTYNNLQFTRCISGNGNDQEASTSASSFQPFTTLDDTHPTLYLGFDKKIEQGPIFLFFSLKEKKIAEGVKKPKLDLYYYSNTSKEWNKLESEDDTEGLRQTGTVKLFLPDDFGDQQTFGKSLFWIKLINSNDIFSKVLPGPRPTLQAYNLLKHRFNTIFVPQVKAIYTNTSYAIHAAKINNEILGSSVGLPFQTFKFAKRITENSKVEVWINEGKLLEEVENRNRQFVEEGEEEEQQKQIQIQEEKDAEGNLINTWILWQRTDDIYAAGPNDRYYFLDTASATILFGDGKNGLIPRAGQNNIKATYIAGGGSEGNIDTNEIKSLKTPIPFVDSVTNPEPAEGGLDVEPVDQALIRGPYKVKNRGQPITGEDFELLVRERFPSLARVKCMPTTNSNGAFEPGYVTIVIVPSSQEDKPIPSLGLLHSIEQCLSAIASLPIVSANRLDVIAPLYIKASVTAVIYPISIDAALDAERRATDALREFFHPLRGRADRKGWDFGSIVSPIDIYELFKSIPEIDHISNLLINFEYEYEENYSTSNSNSNLTGTSIIKSFTIDENSPNPSSSPLISSSKSLFVPPHSLLYSGDHKLTIKFVEDKRE